MWSGCAAEDMQHTGRLSAQRSGDGDATRAGRCPRCVPQGDAMPRIRRSRRILKHGKNHSQQHEKCRDVSAGPHVFIVLPPQSEDEQSLFEVRRHLFLLFRHLRHDGFGEQQEAGRRHRILERDAEHLCRIDDPGLHDVQVLTPCGIEAEVPGARTHSLDDDAPVGGGVLRNLPRGASRARFRI